MYARFAVPLNGIKVFAYCTDARLMGGAVGIHGCTHIAYTIDAAAAEGAPVIGLWHSGGARLAEGAEAMHGIGIMFAAMVRASGRIPQLSVVLGQPLRRRATGPG